MFPNSIIFTSFWHHRGKGGAIKHLIRHLLSQMPPSPQGEGFDGAMRAADFVGVGVPDDPKNNPSSVCPSGSHLPQGEGFKTSPSRLCRATSPRRGDLFQSFCFAL